MKTKREPLLSRLSLCSGSPPLLVASAIPGLPEEVSILEGSHRHSITGWKSELRALKRSMSKAGAKGSRSSPAFWPQQTKQPEWDQSGHAQEKIDADLALSA